MADVNFPQANDLATMMNLPFMQYKQMQNQIGLANQFAQQNLEGGSLDNRRKVLDNTLAEESNPLKVQGLRIANDTNQSEADVKRVEARKALELEPEAIAAKRAEYMAKATEDQLKKLNAQAETDMMSDDPAIQQRGLKKFMASKSEQERRNKQKDTMEVHKMDNDSAERRSAGNNAATLGAAQIGANARVTAAQARGKGIQDFAAAVAAGKISPAKASVYYAMQAQQSQDPEEQAQFIAAAKQFEALAQSTSGAPKTGVDVPAVAGMPAMQAPSAFGPRPQPSAPAGGQPPAPPPGWKMK